MRYLIVHKDDAGIFLGEFLGLGFFSKVDPVGQDAAVTFPTIAACVDYLNSWSSTVKGELRITEYTFVPVEPSIDDRYASIQDCVDAGLEAWDPGEVQRVQDNFSNG